jgi:hypothetical protein
MFTFEDPALRFDDTCHEASVLWQTFVRKVRAEEVKAGRRPPTEFAIAKDILEPPSLTISTWAARFGYFCLIEQPPATSRRRLLELHVEWRQFNKPASGPSWIYWDTKERATVVLNDDLSEMDRKTALGRRAATFAYLHEVAHLVLEEKPTFPRNLPGLAIASNPQFELRAWWFCITILKMVVGAYAYGSRNTNQSAPHGFDNTLMALIGANLGP